MLRLHRHRSDRSSDKIEFRLSSLQAFKIPRPWDKLVLLIISVETGKVVTKSSKATVRSGTCQWTETESFWVSQDDSSKKLEESQFKIVVSTGSARSAFLGEIVLTLTDYLASGDSGPLLLTLNNCSSSTTLQVRIQCILPKSKSRGGRARENTFQYEDKNSNNDDSENKSDGSDNTFSRSIGSSLSNQFGVASNPDELGHRDKILSASGSHHSSDSGDGSLARTNFSPISSSNGASYVGKLDSSGTHISQSYGRAEDSSESPNELLDEEIDELHDEVKMWERHSRQLKVDIGILKKEISDKSQHQAELETELSAAYSERDGLKRELEKLQLALEESVTNQPCIDTKGNRMLNVEKELEDELRFLKESNANLTEQLRKTQESNIELVSILQELEDTVEKQKLEIANLSHNQVTEHEGSTMSQKPPDNEEEWERKLSLKEQEIVKLEKELSNMIDKRHSNEVPSDGSHSDLMEEIEALKTKVQELEKDCAELTDENLDFMYKMNKMSKENDSHDSVSFESQSRDVNEKLGPEITFLKLRISELEEELQKEEDMKNSSSSKLKDLEKLCDDLESELQYFRDEAGDLEARFQKAQVELEEKNVELSDLRQQLEYAQDFAESNEKLREEIGSLQSSKIDLEDLVFNLQKEKSQLEEDLADLHKENNNFSKLLEDVQHDLEELTNTLDSQVSTNKVLEKKLKELESFKTELQLQISELEQENVQLSKLVSELEAQVRYLTNDKESNRLELEKSRSLIVGLKDEIERRTAEMEMQKGDAKQKLQEVQKQMSEALEESEILRRSNSQIQATNESLMEEHVSLQKSTGDLKKQKLDMHENIMCLEVELNQSEKTNLDLLQQVESLEGRLSSMQKDISIKEKSILSQMESIFQECQEHEEKISQVHIMLNKLEEDKAIEIDNLEREIAHLTAQMSSTDDEKEQIASAAVREASNLRADKARLESSLQEANAKVKLYETDIQTLRRESKTKIQGLVGSMKEVKQNEEMLMADNERMKRLMEGLKSSEEKSRKLANEFELKVKTCDYEKQQITEEMSDLKVHLQKISHLQDDILNLKASLDDAKFEKGKLEDLLKSVSEECEELKADRDLLNNKILSMKTDLSSGEDDRVRLENDLLAKEASHANDAELKNELSRAKRSNSEYQRRIKSLVQERDEFMMKAQLVEEELTRKKELYEKSEVTRGSKGLHHEVEEARGIEVNPESKIHLLETKLAEALEANGMYNQQLEENLAAKQAARPQDAENSANDNDASSSNTTKISSLESELKDMKDRYLQMSLQYAEVEAEREELVMQLKSAKKEKRWFS